SSYRVPELLLKTNKGVRPGRAGHFEGVTLAVPPRSLAIDLLQATGLTSADAKQFLPSLVLAAADDAIGPRPMTRAMRAIAPPATTEAIELLITDRSDPDRRRGGSGPAADDEETGAESEERVEECGRSVCFGGQQLVEMPTQHRAGPARRQAVGLQ